jgi:hypothetical protein
MPVQKSETPASVIAFAPKKGSANSTMLADDAGQHATTAADDAGQHIIALVHKASDVAKADCQRAMDVAHRLSSELRAAEEKAREFEAEANYFRDRAARAEEWLVRIHTEVQQTFFQNKDQQKQPVRERKVNP